ncbi:uncharacterized protein isoform X6 [Leptinotarsa decemlineata]|uniref:uncharacterized protein isoform X6 n=1 Tax=Leptinotarsa decemlineata TaxID=7539 RepID=UPI003D30C24B
MNRLTKLSFCFLVLVLAEGTHLPPPSHVPAPINIHVKSSSSVLYNPSNNGPVLPSPPKNGPASPTPPKNGQVSHMPPKNGPVLSVPPKHDSTFNNPPKNGPVSAGPPKNGPVPPSLPKNDPMLPIPPKKPQGPGVFSKNNMHAGNSHRGEALHIKDIVKNVVSGLDDTVEGLVKGQVGAAASFVSNVAHSTRDGVWEGGELVTNFVKDNVHADKRILGILRGGTKDLFKDKIENVNHVVGTSKKIVSGAIHGVGHIVAAPFRKVREGIQGIGHHGKAPAEKTKEGVQGDGHHESASVDKTKGAVHGVGRIVTAPFRAIKGAVHGVGHIVSAPFRKVREGFQDVGHHAKASGDKTKDGTEDHVKRFFHKPEDNSEAKKIEKRDLSHKISHVGHILKYPVVKVKNAIRRLGKLPKKIVKRHVNPVKKVKGGIHGAGHILEDILKFPIKTVKYVANGAENVVEKVLKGTKHVVKGTTHIVKRDVEPKEALQDIAEAVEDYIIPLGKDTLQIGGDVRSLIVDAAKPMTKALSGAVGKKSDSSEEEDKKGSLTRAIEKKKDSSEEDDKEGTSHIIQPIVKEAGKMIVSAMTG